MTQQMMTVTSMITVFLTTPRIHEQHAIGSKEKKQPTDYGPMILKAATLK